MNLYLYAQSCLNVNADKVSGLTDYPEIKTELDSNLEETGKLLGEQSTDKRGAAKEKEARKNDLIAILMKISRFIVAYATSKDLPDLLQKVKLAQSKLDKIADTTLKDKATEIIRIANENLAAVGPYGLKNDMLMEANDKVAAYFDVITKPRLTNKRAGEIRKEITERQKVSDKLFTKIDALVAILKDTEPLFCGTYTGARKIGNEGTRHLALKVQVNEAGSGAGLNKAMLELVPQNGKGKAGTELSKSVKYTGAKGGAMIKSLDSGTYLMMVNKPGFVAQTATVYVSEGEMTSVVIELVKS